MIEEIVNLLPSPDLKAKIKETDYSFSDMELLTIICNYAPTLHSKHSFLERFSKNATPDIAMFAKKIIESDKNNFANFIKESNEFVYELHIKDTPYSHDERYICKSYNAALICIDRFFEEYAHVGAKKTEETRYTIDKRKIFSECDEFEEDEYAECILGANKEILSISDWRVPHECDPDVACCECEKLCPAKLDDLKFPYFAYNFAIIKHREYDGKVHFGVVLSIHEENDGPVSEFYVIPLDSRIIREHKFSEYFYAHQHIPLPLATIAAPEDLDEDMREDYYKFIEFLEANPLPV